jgi:hypothetical protein
MASTSSIAIGSSMMASVLRASDACTFNVSSAVSDTPVRVVPAIFGSELTGANLRHAQALRTLSIVRRLRVVVDDLYRFLPIVLPIVLSSVLDLETCQ